ncbi:MAG: M56 family metallopeptidase, partial [Verrucomicrobia bacterium]|nr:M56 family metallopeptidase [Verrucomicrobiota bacterium]
MTASLLSVFEMVTRMSGSASVLILALLGLSCLLWRWLPMPVIYALSLLVLIRLAIPFFPHSDYSLLQLIPKVIGLLQPETIGPVAEVVEPINVLSNLQSVEVEAGEGVSPIWNWIAMTWVLVFGVLISRQLCSYIRFLKWLGYQPVVLEPQLKSLLAECQKLVGVERKVALLSVDQMRIPAVFGIIKPRILLPEQLVKQLSRTELKHILLHELCHVRRGDALIGLLASLVATVHWFNPLVWFANRQFSLVRELLCDRSVLRALKGAPESEQSYGETLLRAATLFTRQACKAPGLVPFLSHKDEIKERLTMIVKPTSKHWLRTVAGLITGTGLAVASMTLVALPHPSDDDGKGERKERREHVESDQDREKSDRRARRERGESDRDEREGEGDERRRDRDRQAEDRDDEEGEGREYRDREM